MVLIKTSNVYSTLLALLVPASVRVFYKIVPRSSMELAHLVLSFSVRLVVCQEKQRALTTTPDVTAPLWHRV